MRTKKGTDSRIKREIKNNYLRASVGDWAETRGIVDSLSAKFQQAEFPEAFVCSGLRVQFR